MTPTEDLFLEVLARRLRGTEIVSVAKYEVIRRMAEKAIHEVGLEVEDDDVKLWAMAVLDALRGIIPDEYYPDEVEF